MTILTKGFKFSVKVVLAAVAIDLVHVVAIGGVYSHG